MMPEGPSVLVTRTAPGCFDTAERLRAEGLRPIIEPALKIHALPTPLPELNGVSGLIFTSANGVRFFTERSARRDFNAWCVGPSTAASAAEAGFADIFNADGNADDLVALIARQADPARGRLLHIANDAAAGEVVKSLQTAGFDAEFAALYTTSPAKDLGDTTLSALKQDTLSSVLIHSAKGAAAIAPLLTAFRLKSVNLVAISDKAAAPLTHLDWKQTAIADAPNEDALINALLMCYTPD